MTLSNDDNSPTQLILPTNPEPKPKPARKSLSLKRAPTKYEQKEAKRVKQEETKTAKLQEEKTLMKNTSLWIAKWAKDNITYQDTAYLLGKSSLNIPGQDGHISTSYTYQPQKTGGIIRSLEKLYDQKSTSVLKLHVLVACLSTLLPALIVTQLSKFLPSVIKNWQCASLIHWELILGKTKISLQIPKGELIYFEQKAQHEIQFHDDWISSLLHPMKIYITMPNSTNVVSVKGSTMTLEFNRVPFHSKEDSTVTQDVFTLCEKIKSLCFTYVKTKLSMKGKQRDYYAQRLKGLQSSSAGTSMNDLKLLYALPRHWYFRNAQNRDLNVPKNTSSDKTQQPTTSTQNTTE